jgi:hypothetical protein
MLGKTKTSEQGHRFHAQERLGRFPRIALRQRSSDHPMVMFAMLVSAAFVSMALMMPASSAVVAKPSGAPVKIADQFRETGKASRLPSMTDAGQACHGQSWGAESEECLVVIARESGKTEARNIRMIANAEPLKTVPNVF